MCNISKLYDKIIRNSKEAEKQYLSIVTPKATAEKFKESPMTDEAFKEQLVRALRNNVLDTDIRITGDMAIGEKECSGLFLRTLSDETLLNECKARGLDVKYSEETELACRLNWIMQDYYKAGEDEEERVHRVKCYKLFWDALEDSEFFNRLESQKEELTKLQEKCKKFVEKQNEQKHEDTMDEFTRNIRNLITDKLTVHTKGLDGSEISSTVFIDDKTAIEPSLPVMPTPRTAWGCDGTICTNPQMDCINCPRKTTGIYINASESNSFSVSKEDEK